MKIKDIDLGKYPVLLAPMEDVTDPAFRLMCKGFGADMVYTEFVSSDALIRSVSKTEQKLNISDEERPVAIQIYGKDTDTMVEAARIVEQARPDILDINFGCPVKRVAGKGAGAGMLQNIPKMLEITRAVADAVKIPVTVKTRLGWDAGNKIIVDLAEQLQDCGIAALTIHGRTRAQMYTGEADWTLIGEVKNNPRMHIPVIGNGVVVDPGVLVKEMAMLEAEGISCKNLKISCDAHVIMPYHKDLDGADEKSLGDHKIGTTKRGIGPCYQDKVARKGIRIQDLMDEKIFRLKVETALIQKNAILEKIYGLHTYTVEEICEEYLPYARILKPYMAETSQMLNNAVREGKSILFEGAQGTLLDIDHGTYPYVTSSSCCAGGAATGSGVGPVNIDRVLGIQKAYITRVGGGPFPTELTYAEDGGEGLEAEEGETLCQVGHEYGVTTGRKRRCGWFDAVIARYAADVNGLTDVALTKLDVLSAFDTIKVCVAYECNGERYDYFPMQQSVLFHAKPVYEELPGWKGEDITACRTFDELPENAKSYVEYLEKKVGVPISIVAVGPDRDQTIMRGW